MYPKGMMHAFFRNDLNDGVGDVGFCCMNPINLFCFARKEQRHYSFLVTMVHQGLEIPDYLSDIWEKGVYENQRKSSTSTPSIFDSPYPGNGQQYAISVYYRHRSHQCNSGRRYGFVLRRRAKEEAKEAEVTLDCSPRLNDGNHGCSGAYFNGTDYSLKRSTESRAK